MIGVLIITHESIGEAYRALAHHFFPDGAPGCVHILGVQPTENHDDVINNAVAVLQEFPDNHGILIMTDIFGATPCNAARRMVRENKSAIITGLNAPMMIKAVQYAPRMDNLAEFTALVKEAGIRGIMTITAAPDDLVCKQKSDAV